MGVFSLIFSTQWIVYTRNRHQRSDSLQASNVLLHS